MESTHLYKIFVQDLLLELEENSLGYHLGNVYIGTPTCADDVQIPPSESTIILSGRTQSFVGLEESVTLKIVRQNRPTKSSQVGVRVRVRVSHVGVSLYSQLVKLYLALGNSTVITVLHTIYTIDTMT